MYSDEEEEQGGVNIADLLPRVDITNQITEALLGEINDKNWKTRNEGLVKLQSEFYFYFLLVWVKKYGVNF